jgi:hypothetical protein
MEKHYYILFLAGISFLLFVLIFKWIDYLTINRYIVESFQQQTNNTTSHTVDLPLTTTYSCKNFCGPTSRCAITGQQCFTDIDCPGCQPKTNNAKKQSNTSANVPGNDDAGKLTYGMTPQYSILTSDMGTRATKILGNEFSKSPSAMFGIDIWRDDFDEERRMFDKRYKPPANLKGLPSYPTRYSVTGDFIEEGPLASNAILN